MKTCTKCGVARDIDNFSIRNASSDGRSSRCKSCQSAADADLYQRNRVKRIQQATDYKNADRERYRAYRRQYKAQKRATDMQWKLKERGRKRRWDALKGNLKKAPYLDLVGCSIEFFHKWIEDQFKPGMTWQNWGSVWQLDEIIPCEAFDLTNPDEEKLCWHYTNSRPLWAQESMSRGGLMTPAVIAEYRKEIDKLLSLPAPVAHSSLLTVPTPKLESPPPLKIKEYEPRQKLTDEQLQKIKELHNEGYNRAHISTVVGVRKRVIQYVVKKLGIQGSAQKYSAVDVEKIKALRVSGISIADIAKTLNMSENAVGYLLTKNGVVLTADQRSAIKTKWSVEQKLEIKRRRDAGEPLRVIAESMGIPLGTVKRLAVE